MPSTKTKWRHPFARASWWTIIPLSIIYTTVISVLLVIPSLSKRNWEVPAEQQLLHTQGVFQTGHTNSKWPYTLIAAGGHKMDFSCQPFIDNFNYCLSAPLQSRAMSNRTAVSVGYFVSRNVYIPSNIVVTVNSPSGPILEYRTQRLWLLKVAKIEDNDKILHIILLIVAALLELYLAIGIMQKYSSHPLNQEQ